MSCSKQIRTLNKVLQTLDCEGFTPYAGNQIMRWYMLHRKEEAKELQNYLEVRDEFRKLMHGKSKHERKIIGTFISMEKAQSAHVILKMMLAAGMMDTLGGLEDEGEEER